MRINSFFRFVLAVAVSELAGVFGSAFTIPSVAGWYAHLAKPTLAPPNWLFGPVWTVLYALIGIALYFVWEKHWRVAYPVAAGSGRKAWNPLSERLWRGDLQTVNVVAVFSVQYVLNIAWSYFFFGLRSPSVAFFEILALWVSIVYVIVNFYRISRAAAGLLVPYLLWVSFAAYLNYAIWTLN